jgi:multidrug resistance protein, MATE family
MSSLSATTDASEAARRPRGSLRPIFALGAPLIAFFLVQNVAGLVSLSFIGGLGNAGLVGYGAANAIFSTLLALMFGFDTGVQAIVARATGGGHAGRVGEILTDAWAATLPLGLVIAAIAWLAAPTVLGGVLPDRAAATAGVANLRAAAPALVLYGLTIPINACWIGSGRPGISFLVTAIMAPIQIALTYALVVGVGPVPSLGMTGAGLAGVLGMLMTAAIQLALALRIRPIAGLFRVRPKLSGAAAIVAIGWPISVQQSLVQLSLIVLFAIVARLGVGPAAIGNVLVSLMGVPIQVMNGLAIAAATLVGQAMGRGAPGEAARWGWRTTVVGVVLTAPVAFVLLAAPEPLLRIYLHDPATLAASLTPARIVGLGVATQAVALILGFAFRGAGATKIAAGVPFVTLWLVQLPLTWWIAVAHHQGLLGVVWLQTALTFVDAALLATLWAVGVWRRVRIGGGLAS